MKGIPSSMFYVAMLLSYREASDQARELIDAAMDNPNPETVRAVLLASVGQPWRARIEGALIEIGIAASGNLERPK